jgi:hypothetical protein
VTDRRQSMSPNPEEKYKHDNEVLVLQVEALQAQLQEQTKIAKEQVSMYFGFISLSSCF